MWRQTPKFAGFISNFLTNEKESVNYPPQLVPIFIMAHTLSAKKRIRQTETRTAANRATMSRVRTLRKKVTAAVAEKDKEAAVAAYDRFASAIDKAAKKGTVHPNRAANYKSKAAKAIGSLS